MRRVKRTPLKRSQKPLRRTPLKKSGKGLSRGFFPSTDEEKEERARMLQLFLDIWDERQDEKGYCYCFETGKPMHRNYYRENTACYDHVLEKHHWTQYKFTKKNIIIVTPEVHNQKGTNLDFTPKIKAYREELFNLHSTDQLI